MTLDKFLETAWNDHADRPQEVADRLAGALHLMDTSDHIPPFTRLLTHVYGEHLGQWRRGIELLDAVRALPAFDGSIAVAGRWPETGPTLLYCDGDPAALGPLSPGDRVAVLAAAAAALAGRTDFGRALAAYTEALDLAKAGLPAGSPAIRALAVGGNNIAAALEEKNDRSAEETEGMICAAEGGLAYWKLAGTWLEEERAEYRLARSLLEAGRPQPAPGKRSALCADLRDNARPRSNSFSLRRCSRRRNARPEKAPRLPRRVPAPWRCSSKCRKTRSRGARSTLRDLGLTSGQRRGGRSGASSRQPNSRAKSIETRACTAPCSSKKRCVPAPGEHAFVPDIRMDVEAARAVEAEADELLRPHVVAGQRERD